MAKTPSIFDKAKLRPAQLRTVAERRFGDAEALVGTKRNERANGAMYLGGFVIECLMKARLLERFAWLGSAGSPEGRPREEQRLWSLCYRSHDLDEILAVLPELMAGLMVAEQRGQLRLVESLRAICTEWTIYARYSPRSAMMKDAERFLERIEELKEWLK